MAARVALLLGMAVGLELWLSRIGQLPEASYRGPAIVTELAARLFSHDLQGPLTLATLLAGVILALRHRSLGPGWHDLGRGRELRAIAMVAAVLTAWVFATYDYNFYLDRPHQADRLLLILFLPLIYWRPVFTLPFLALVFAVGWQFRHPIEGHSWAAPILPVRVLLLAAAAWAARILTRRPRPEDFVFLLCCLVAAHYWVSGLGKLRLGWIHRDTVAFLLPSTYANGWLGFLDPATIGRVTATLVELNWPLKLGTLAVEIGALLALWRRVTLRIFLAGAIVFHAAAAALSGIFFWSWMALDAAVLVLFLRARKPSPPIFTPAYFALSLVVIGGGMVWFRPVRLSWLDARATYTHRMVGVTADGRTHALPPAFFAPFDFQFTLNAFRYLVREPRLLVTWGATAHPPVAEGLARAHTADAVFSLERRMGVLFYNVERAAEFDRFMRAFVGHWNARGQVHWWWEPLQPPPLLLTFPRRDPGTGGAPIERVVVREVTSFFDGARYREIRDLPVRHIAITR